jgi:hypothetical protein
MPAPSEEELAELLIGIIADGFNRSWGALERAGAVDSKMMREHYNGVGSKFYDLVTEQIVLTAKYGASGLRRRFLEAEEESGPRTDIV